MKKCLPDIPIAIVSLTFLAIGYTLPVFTNADEWLSIGSFSLNWFSFSSIFGILNGCISIITRSAMSLAVDSNEIGKIFSVLSLFGGFINSGIGAIFQQLYNKTLDTLPGAYLLLVTSFVVISIPTNMIMYKLLKSFKEEKDEEMKPEKYTQLTKF